MDLYLRLPDPPDASELSSSDQINNAFIIVRKKERIGGELQNIAWAAEDLSFAEKAGDKVLKRLAFSHDNDLVSMADIFIGRAVESHDESVFKWRRRCRVIEKIEPESRRPCREIGVRSGNSHASAPAL